MTRAGGVIDRVRGGAPTAVRAASAHDRPEEVAEDGTEARSNSVLAQPAGFGRWRRLAGTLVAGLLRRGPAATPARTASDDTSRAVAPAWPGEGPGVADGGKQVKPLVPVVAHGPTPRGVVLVAVMGLPDEQLDAAIDAALAHRNADGVVPVFLTDSCAFEKFVRRRVLFEHHPAPDSRSQTIGRIDWDLFERRRLQRLLAKWRPLRVIAFGAEAKARLDQWQAGGR